MERLTKRVGHIITYTGKFTRRPGVECAASMGFNAIQDCLQRLEAYEDTGLTPEQINTLKLGINRIIEENKRK